MSKVYGVIGSGTASEKAIVAALNDLPEDSSFIIGWSRPTPEGRSTVYDWLIDNEKKFVLVSEQGVPKGLQQHADDVVYYNGINLDGEIISLTAAESGTILVMWNDGIERSIFMAANEGLKTLELTNGLMPLTVEPDPIDEEEQTSPDEEDDDEEEFSEPEPLTLEEVESMPSAALRKYAEGQGLNVTGKSKVDIIGMLFKEHIKTDVEVRNPLRPAEVDFRNPLKPSASVMGNRLPQTYKPLEKETSEASSISSIVVVMKDGTTVTITANESKLDKLFKMINA